jgi:FRG domain
MSKDPILSVKDMIARAESLSEDREPHRHLRCWFRGQSDSRWELTPRLYRLGLTPEEVANTERHMVQDFEIMSASIRNGAEKNHDLYFLQQHYGMPTRLLDWTTNPLIALYFACEPIQDNQCGKVFFLDAYELVKSKQPDGRNFGIATSGRPAFRAWMDHIFGWIEKPKEMISETFPIRPEHFDRRIGLQQGCFTFHVPERPTIPETDPVQSFIIPSGSKKAIRDQLAAINIHHFSVYGDLRSLAQFLSETYGF